MKIFLLTSTILMVVLMIIGTTQASPVTCDDTLSFSGRKRTSRTDCSKIPTCKFGDKIHRIPKTISPELITIKTDLILKRIEAKKSYQDIQLLEKIALAYSEYNIFCKDKKVRASSETSPRFLNFLKNVNPVAYGQYSTLLRSKRNTPQYYELQKLNNELHNIRIFIKLDKTYDCAELLDNCHALKCDGIRKIGLDNYITNYARFHKFLKQSRRTRRKPINWRQRYNRIRRLRLRRRLRRSRLRRSRRPKRTIRQKRTIRPRKRTTKTRKKIVKRKPKRPRKRTTKTRKKRVKTTIPKRPRIKRKPKRTNKQKKQQPKKPKRPRKPKTKKQQTKKPKRPRKKKVKKPKTKKQQPRRTKKQTKKPRKQGKFAKLKKRIEYLKKAILSYERKVTIVNKAINQLEAQLK